jgi:hypothetical protein
VWRITTITKNEIILQQNLASKPMTVENEVANENKSAANVTLSDVISETVSDVALPSPVADMPEAPAPLGRTDAGVSPMSAAGATVNVAAASAGRGRGRPRKTAAPGAAPTGQAKPRPNLNGVPNSTVSGAVNMETAGIEPCAELCVMMVNASGMALGGEAAAMQGQEIMLAKNGFVAYFKAKGIHNVPAWVVLAGALSPYYLRVLTTTPAKTTVSTLIGRGVFRVKEIWKAKKNARSNRRNNNERQNNTSPETSDTSA